MRTGVRVLAVVAVLAACQPAQERTSQAAQPRRATVAAAVEAPPAAYPIATVDRLRIVLPWSGRALREPRIDVKSPNGRLYAQLPVTVETDAAGGTATAVLEVRGTNIDGYRMVGTWRFVLVDGAGPPLATQAIDLH